LTQARKDAQETLEKLRRSNERLVQQELENNLARLDVLRLVEQLGKREDKPEMPATTAKLD
jgi:hypothetical protein